MVAAMGMSSSCSEDTTRQTASNRSSTDSAAFAVTQALVSLLAQKGWNNRLLQAQLSAEKGL